LYVGCLGNIKLIKFHFSTFFVKILLQYSIIFQFFTFVSICLSKNKRKDI
jgi:hypothetical protein